MDVEVLETLELEETEVLTEVLAVITLAGGPFAAVNEAVNCCAVELPEEAVAEAEMNEFEVVVVDATALETTTLACA